MPRISLTVPHQLGQEEALRRVQKATNVARKMYESKLSNVEEEWSGNTLNLGLTVMGAKIKGTVGVEPQAVAVNVELPMIASMFKGAIERGIRGELEKVLA